MPSHRSLTGAILSERDCHVETHIAHVIYKSNETNKISKRVRENARLTPQHPPPPRRLFPPLSFHLASPHLTSPRLASPTTRCREPRCHRSTDIFHRVAPASEAGENADVKSGEFSYVHLDPQRAGCPFRPFFSHVEKIHCLAFSQVCDMRLLVRPKFIFSANHT